MITHNIHNRQTSKPPAGLEPTIPASDRPQTGRPLTSAKCMHTITKSTRNEISNCLPSISRYTCVYPYRYTTLLWVQPFSPWNYRPQQPHSPSFIWSGRMVITRKTSSPRSKAVPVLLCNVPHLPRGLSRGATMASMAKNRRLTHPSSNGATPQETLNNSDTSHRGSVI